MSCVTGIVICFSCAEDYTERADGTDRYPILEEINSWLSERGKLPLVKLDEKMSCGKHPQMNVFGGGYNYLGDGEFLELFATRNWKEKDQVFMIFNPEEGPIQVIKP